jgi:YggT family protein
MERHVTLALASVRTDIANYLNALFEVYILIIFIYILLNMMFSLGVRLPYARWSDALLSFLRDVCEPYLRIFRRLIPPLGMFDFSPIVGIFALIFLDRIVVAVIG